MNQRLDLRRRERSLDRPLPSFNREQSMERIRLNREQSIERIRLNRERSMERIRLNRERERSLERARQEIDRVRREREASVERPRTAQDRSFDSLNDISGNAERSRLGKEQLRVRRDQGRSRLDQERACLVEQERSRLVEQERARLVEQERKRLEQELDRSITNERLRMDLDRPQTDRSSIHSEDYNRDRQMELYLSDIGNMDFYQTLPRRRKKFDSNGVVSVTSPDSLEDRLQKLEMERDSLSLQVSVLTDQVEAQTDKIQDLESGLNKRDSSIHKELNSRSALETHKLDLMAEVSQMKIRLAASEKERKELEDRLSDAQRRIDDLQGRLNGRTIEVADLRNSINKNVANSPSDHTDVTKSLERERSMEKEKTIERLRRKHSEVEKLKKAVECLMASNEEKDRRIDELRRTLKRHKKTDEVVTPTQKKDLLSLEDDISDSSSTHNSSSSGAEHPTRDGHHHNGFDRLDVGEPSDLRMHLPNPSATSTPVNSHKIDYKPPLPAESQSMTPPSVISYHQAKSKSLPRSNSVEEIRQNSVSKTPPAPRHRGEGYEAEEALKDAMAQEYKNLQQNSGRNSMSQEKKKQKGIKKFFGRLRRSSSQDMNQEQLEEFRRSGLRATAGPRLGWSKDLNYKDIDVPFARWDSDQVAAWLHSVGLSMYVGDCKRWVKNGNQLLKASQHDLEKELNIRNHFHRKKLQLALQSAGSSETNKTGMDRLDHNLVTRWLDDIGLPQYKDTFFEARIDGRMLHNMTMEDLIGLKITNALHHLSLKSAIHILRRNNFNTMCLIRRPSPDEVRWNGPLHNIPQEVMLWSNHRVMEWLRTIDLSEYAPNLRGSGVHGGLMVLEPRFGADIFATILSIPNTKTLLRRHLSTHFVSLIGNDHQHKKRELESRPGFVPLTPNQKIKFKKFGIFGHKRTRSSEVDFEEFVCPLELNDGANSSYMPNGGSSGRSHERKDSKDTKDSSCYSDDMDKLTSLLAKDRFLDNVPTSDV